MGSCKKRFRRFRFPVPVRFLSHPEKLLTRGSSPETLRAAKRGCFKRGGFPIWTCPSFFVLFCPFGTFPGIFPICAGMVRGFSRLVLFLFLSLLRAPTRNSPERVRDAIWTFPEKNGKHPGLSFSQKLGNHSHFEHLEGLLGFLVGSLVVLEMPIS